MNDLQFYIALNEVLINVGWKAIFHLSQKKLYRTPIKTQETFGAILTFYY